MNENYYIYYIVPSSNFTNEKEEDNNTGLGQNTITNFLKDNFLIIILLIILLILLSKL